MSAHHRHGKKSRGRPKNPPKDGVTQAGSSDAGTPCAGRAKPSQEPYTPRFSFRFKDERGGSTLLQERALAPQAVPHPTELSPFRAAEIIGGRVLRAAIRSSCRPEAVELTKKVLAQVESHVQPGESIRLRDVVSELVNAVIQDALRELFPDADTSKDADLSQK